MSAAEVQPLTLRQKLGLKHARHLVASGVPVFLSRPALDASGVWDPKGGDGGSGYRFPKGWQSTVCDARIVEAWTPGSALCAVTGHGVDLLDVDPRTGGDDSYAELLASSRIPASYGRQATPSGGTHDLIAGLGVASRDKVLPGVDVKAGQPDGRGRGFMFLAPTVKMSKTTGELGTYEWTVAPDLDALTLLGIDTTGESLAAFIRAKRRAADPADAYDGAVYADLSPADQARADAHVARVWEVWCDKLAKAVAWPEGATDQFGRGWELLARDAAWAIAALAATPWTGVDDDTAEALYRGALPEELAADPVCGDKWGSGIIAKVAEKPIDPPPWLDHGSPEDDFGPLDDAEDAGEGTAKRPTIEIQSPAKGLVWVREEAGTSRLSGLFRRGTDMVHTPRIGERGYVPPRDPRSHDGPAQVRRVDPIELAARIDVAYQVAKVSKDEETGQRRTTSILFPLESTRRALAVVEHLPNLRELYSVTHTPIVRADGSILNTPGYDPATRLLYLPDVGLEVPEVPEQPTRAEVVAAGALVLQMIEQFPFVTPHDQANYLGALLTPILRAVVPPPYKMYLIGAPQPGSGKSLLAACARIIHGGVFKSEFPTSPDELRKVITSTLDCTSAPIIQFDNVTGLLKSAVLDGLLTSAEWTDRLLGGNKEVRLANDRMWWITGNNLAVGGDLGRRTLWSTIDAGIPHPERRTDFHIQNLEAWVAEHRGDLLAALLTLVRAWAVAGRPLGESTGSDSFSAWVSTVRGILAVADLGETVGTFDHVASVQVGGDLEADEWGALLSGIWDVFGDEPWTVKNLLAAVDLGAEGGMNEELLPTEVLEKMRSGRGSASKSLGKWFLNRRGRWAGGFCVQAASPDPHLKVARWSLIQAKV